MSSNSRWFLDTRAVSKRNTKFHIVHSNCNPQYANDAFGRSEIRQPAFFILLTRPRPLTHLGAYRNLQIELSLILKRGRAKYEL